MLENRTEPMQEHTWWKLHCASWLLVFCAVVWCCWCWLRSEWEEKNIQTYPYSNCTFHHRISQRVQTSFTVSTDLVKALTNIVYCTCFCHHVRKQDRIHARTNMVKTALRKLFAGILRGWMVLLVLLIGGDRKETIQSYPSHILTALFHNQDSQKKNALYRTIQPQGNIYLSLSLSLSLSLVLCVSLSLSLSLSPSLSRGPR